MLRNPFRLRRTLSRQSHGLTPSIRGSRCLSCTGTHSKLPPSSNGDVIQELEKRGLIAQLTRSASHLPLCSLAHNSKHKFRPDPQSCHPAAFIESPTHRLCGLRSYGPLLAPRQPCRAYHATSLHTQGTSRYYPGTLFFLSFFFFPCLLRAT